MIQSLGLAVQGAKPTEGREFAIVWLPSTWFFQHFAGRPPACWVLWRVCFHAPSAFLKRLCDAHGGVGRVGAPPRHGFAVCTWGSSRLKIFTGKVLRSKKPQRSCTWDVLCAARSTTPEPAASESWWKSSGAVSQMKVLFQAGRCSVCEMCGCTVIAFVLIAYKMRSLVLIKRWIKILNCTSHHQFSSNGSNCLNTPGLSVCWKQRWHN